MSDRAALVSLLLARSVERGEFVLSSGKKSTYYIDARRTTMSSEGLALVGRLGLAAIRQAGWTPAAVGGLTLGADPVAYAVALASRTDPPGVDAFTVRKRPKQHGTERRVEGCFHAGQPVVIVEDVLTTGTSALEAAAAVTTEGGTVLGVLAVVDRLEGGRQALEKAGYAARTLVTLADLGIVA